MLFNTFSKALVLPPSTVCGQCCPALCTPSVSTPDPQLIPGTLAGLEGVELHGLTLEHIQERVQPNEWSELLAKPAALERVAFDRARFPERWPPCEPAKHGSQVAEG